PAAAAGVRRPTTKAAPALQPSPVSNDPMAGLMDDGLGSAFDGDDSSFTETVTGLVTNLGKAFKKRDKPGVTPDAKPTVPGNAGPVATATPAVLPASPFDRASPETAGEGEPPGLRNAKVLAAGAVLLVAIAAAGFWAFNGKDEPAPGEAPTAAQTTTSESQLPSPAAGATSAIPAVDANRLLAEARLARDAGQIFNPTGGNAIELYLAAAVAAPSNKAIAAELAAVIEQALGMAEKAMLENRIDDAVAAIQRISAADPDNTRLPFLSAQLSQMQLRANLDSARAAIRDARFEDAASALSAARALGITDSAEISAVNAELTAARSAQRVDDVLAKAAERLNQNQLIAPANDNARYYYELVLSSEPANPTALQGLTVIASKLVLLARNEIDSGRFDAATELLDDARLLDAGSAALANATEALKEARDRVAADARRQEAERQAAQRAENERIAAEKAEQERLAAEAEAAAQVDTPSDEPVPGGGVSGGNESARNSVQVQDSPLPVSSLQRTKYVAPKYPRSAERRNLSGWVDVVFTVGADGKTTNIEIRGSEPDDIFVDAALRAIEKWEFEPIVENGIVVERQAGVRMMFALE
ncbi:MAG TPA: TonB family protein, partial [Woeseiaceae bacterium]|nr:TonB family protein [Woeseiaceae bacterium]